jgi:hypothetical protein
MVRPQHSRWRSNVNGFSESVEYGILVSERRVAHVQQAARVGIAEEARDRKLSMSTRYAEEIAVACREMWNGNVVVG